MTARERYAQFQRHSTIATDSWTQLSQERREAWYSFNEEIESEKIDVAQRAVRDYQRAASR